MLRVVTENIQRVQDILPTPLAIENIAAPYDWPEQEIPPAEFLSEVLYRTGASLVLDLHNLYCMVQNFGYDPHNYLRNLPLDQLAYVHLAGGRLARGVYLDSHSGPAPDVTLEWLVWIRGRIGPVPAIIEWDKEIPGPNELITEIRRVSNAVGREGVERTMLSEVSRESMRPEGVGDLEEEQYGLLSALLRGGPCPPRFDESQLLRAALSLRNKQSNGRSKRKIESDALSAGTSEATALGVLPKLMRRNSTFGSSNTPHPERRRLAQ